MKSYLKNYHQAPRKVQLVTNLIKGKSAENALTELLFLPKKAALPIKKLLESAIANAKQNFNLDKNKLYVKDTRIDKGVVMKRFMPRARGSAGRINKRMSHVTLILAEKELKK